MGTRVLRPLAVVALLVAASVPAHAADLGIGLPPGPLVSDGVPCGAPVVQTFDSVWQGHFSGGYSHYLGTGESIVLDWRDEKLCFASRRSCDRYVHAMRRDFHRPEGYFTCLSIR